MIDIRDKNRLEVYLLERGIINREEGYSLHYCKGGVSGTVAFVNAGAELLIIKQALRQLKVKEDWFCDPDRMGIEYRCNEIYHRLAPDCAPRVLFYDNDNYIFGREAVPENHLTWKTDLLNGLFDFSVAQKAINTLSTVHNSCANNNEIARIFANKNIFYDLRISPYIEFTVKKYPELTDFALPVINELMERTITLVHGDFSPKNIMTSGRNINIVDFEVAHYGHPSFDLAFFANHFVLKAVKNKYWAGASLSMLDYMLGIYFSKTRYMPANELEQSFVHLLSLLMLARVDGKSPAEYITLNDDKELIRDMAFNIIHQDINSSKEVLRLIARNLTIEI